MAIVRAPKTDKCTTISNELLQSGDLTLRSKSILLYMLSTADDCCVSMADIAHDLNVGNDCVRTAFRELENKGYLIRNRERRENGRFGGANYTV